VDLILEVDLWCAIYIINTITIIKLPRLNEAKAEIITSALIKLAQNKVPYGFPISKMIWGLCNYFETGEFSDSQLWKKAYERISDKAFKLRPNADSWKAVDRKMVTIEHPKPICMIYDGLLAFNRSLNYSRAKELIGSYPPVIITRVENEIINQNGHKKCGDPEERYRHIKIGFALKKFSSF